MTATTAVAGAPAGLAPTRDAELALARMEARRHLTSPILLVALVVCLWSTRLLGAEWSAGTYSLWTTLFVPLALGGFFSCLVAAGRDRPVEGPALAEEAPLDDEARARVHLRAALVFPALAVVGTVAGQVASIVEGGYWIGEGAYRTDTAQHTASELALPVLVVALGAAAGVAAGRRWRRRSPIAILAGLVGFLQWGVYWAFQFVPLIYVSPVQASPVTRWIAPASAVDLRFPASWWVERPAEFNEYWRRVYVDQPLVIGHGVYLAGLIALAVAAALRPPSLVRSAPSRRLRLVGWGLVLGGVVLQLWALGWVLTPGGTGEAQIP